MEAVKAQNMQEDAHKSKIITFAEGIPAFESEKEYILIPLQEPSPFFYLKSANSDLCLLMADPFVFFPDYEIDLPDLLLQELGLNEETTNLMVFSILTVGKNLMETTANLLAPVIINAESRRGMQYIPEQSRYSIKQPLFISRESRPSDSGGQEGR